MATAPEPKAPTGGRFVFTVYNGYQTTTVGAATEAEAVSLARQLRGEGIRFTRPYSGNAVWWAGNFFELVDVQDPQGTSGKARSIMMAAFPNAVFT